MPKTIEFCLPTSGKAVPSGRVPIDAQKILLGAVSSAGAPSPDCTIKASIGRGECIYHLPGDRWYGKMRMDSGKRWFCTIAEAEAAGCRAPKN